MKYGTAKWIIKPGDRKSLSFYVEGVKDYLNDNMYIGDSFFDNSCVKYFFTHDEDLIIDENIINGLGVEYMTREEAINYFKTNTNCREKEEGVFVIQEAFEGMGFNVEEIVFNYYK